MTGNPKPFRVGLILTEQCDVSCAHCWFSCGPEKTATMSFRDAQNYVDKASRAGVEWISLTGGEPMLFPLLVENIVEHASRLGMRTELVTNCNWAKSTETASSTLRSLINAGLNVVNVSADDFHQAFVPFDRVAHVYAAAKRLGLKIVVMSALSNGSSRLADFAAKLGDEIPPPGEANSHAAIGIESGFTPIGRGSSLPLREWHTETYSLTGGCRAVLRDLGVKHNGEVLPCCSASATIPKFSLGKLDVIELGELLDKAWAADIFKVLSKKGPIGLLNEPTEGIYVNKCHLCSKVVNSLLA